MTENFILTIVYLIIGILLSRVFKLPAKTFNYLNLYAIYAALPAMVLLKIPGLTYSPDVFVLAIMPWIMIALSAAGIFFLARILGWKRNTVGALLLLVPLGNTSFLGIPMVSTFFGNNAIPYAVIYDQLGSFLALATFGSIILAVYSREGVVPELSTVLKKVITFPPFIALIAGFLLRFITYPVFVKTTLSAVAFTLVPVVMIAVGFQLTLRIDKKIISPFIAGLTFKLAAAPIAALLICRLANINGLEAKVAVFEAGMPPMVSAGALAVMADLSPSLSVAMVGFGIIISFATLPILFSFL